MKSGLLFYLRDDSTEAFLRARIEVVSRPESSTGRLNALDSLELEKNPALPPTKGTCHEARALASSIGSTPRATASLLECLDQIGSVVLEPDPVHKDDAQEPIVPDLQSCLESYCLSEKVETLGVFARKINNSAVFEYLFFRHAPRISRRLTEPMAIDPSASH